MRLTAQEKMPVQQQELAASTKEPDYIWLTHRELEHISLTPSTLTGPESPLDDDTLLLVLSARR